MLLNIIYQKHVHGWEVQRLSSTRRFLASSPLHRSSLLFAVVSPISEEVTVVAAERPEEICLSFSLARSGLLSLATRSILSFRLSRPHFSLHFLVPDTVSSHSAGLCSSSKLAVIQTAAVGHLRERRWWQWGCCHSLFKSFHIYPTPPH